MELMDFYGSCQAFEGTSQLLTDLIQADKAFKVKSWISPSSLRILKFCEHDESFIFSLDYVYDQISLCPIGVFWDLNLNGFWSNIYILLRWNLTIPQWGKVRFCHKRNRGKKYSWSGRSPNLGVGQIWLRICTLVEQKISNNK